MQIPSGHVGMILFPRRSVPARPFISKKVINGKSCYIKRFFDFHKYIQEKEVYRLIEGEPFVPKLLGYCNKSLILVTEDAGTALSKVDLNLKEREDELVGMIDTLYAKYGLYHNDLRPRNITVDADGKLWLIDFEHTSSTKRENPYLFREDVHGFRRIYF
jgi:RIO-like serine/threonine protein kinase